MHYSWRDNSRNQFNKKWYSIEGHIEEYGGKNISVVKRNLLNADEHKEISQNVYALGELIEKSENGME